ncbi:hypothetical protein ABZ747_28770 [Kitasatospora cineracea]|uniref:hypothetical protein n=1 Tax=Kitasatospora cineracea TaxID=88074 RepID=UPI0033F6AEA5
MGLIHAWRMQKPVADARTAHQRGGLAFVTGFDLDRPVPVRRIRKEIDVVIRAVEAVGRRCVGVEPFLASVEIGFVRA